MNYAKIKFFDIANGRGLRTTLFVSGCNLHCKGCFNREAWDYNYGDPYNEDVEELILQSIKADYIDGLSILGGEPLSQPQDGLNELTKLCRHAKELNKSVWLYTGLNFEDVKDYDIMNYVDVVVDGRFIEELRDITLPFRGSSNQRIIDVQKSLKTKQVITIK